MNPQDDRTTDFSLFDYWRVLRCRWRFVVTTTVLAAIIAAGLSLIWPKTYKASAVIMPLSGQKAGGLAAAVAQMGLGSLIGGFADASSSTSQILALLRSRTLREKVITKYQFLPILFEKQWDKATGSWKKKPPNMDDALDKLSKVVKIIDNKKDQTISISAITDSPQISANMANAFIDELSAHINENTFTVAKKNRIFIEEQLERNKIDLLESGKELSKFYSANRVSNEDPVVDVSIGPEEGLKASGLENDSELLSKELNEVNEKIRKARVVEGVPQQVYLQYLVLRQKLLGQVNALLTQQYEMAKIEESKEDLTFQVIDQARPPFQRYSPKRAQAVLTTFVAAAFLSIFYVLFGNYWNSLKAGGGP